MKPAHRKIIKSLNRVLAYSILAKETHFADSVHSRYKYQEFYVAYSQQTRTVGHVTTPLVCKFAQFGRQLLPNLHIKNFSLNFKLLYIDQVFCTNYVSIFNCISSSTIKYPYPLIRFIQSQQSNLQNCTHIRSSKSIFAYVPIQDLVLLSIKLSTICDIVKKDKVFVHMGCTYH